MRLLFDAMSGDNAPIENLKGARLAADQFTEDQIILVGREAELRRLAGEQNIPLDRLEFLDAPDLLTMEDDPMSILRAGKNSSMAVGFRALAEGKGDAYVTAGNTGAFVAGATFIVKRMSGIKRPALAPLIPSKEGFYQLLDVGANAVCRPEMLVQFGLMGSIYMKKIMKIENPRVGLVNIGVEDHKGTPLQQEAYQMMKNQHLFNFIGNAEARDIPLGVCDVAVCDGFTGNVILKTSEGLSKMLMTTLKEAIKSSFKSMMGGLLVKGSLGKIKKSMDYKEQGGAVLLGVKAPCIKAHGSSDAKAFYNALRQARNVVSQGVIPAIQSGLAEIRAQEKDPADGKEAAPSVTP